MAARIPIDPVDPTLSLSMAVVASSSEPLLLIDGAFKVIAASQSFCAAFEIDPASVKGLEVMALGAGEWSAPQLRSLLTAAAEGVEDLEAYEMDLTRPNRPARRLVIRVQRLVYHDADHPRLLVTVSDVTDARADKKAMDDALTQNGILLQEVRHRVANSLQIIASVLLQTARRTNSEETRGHLRDAHHRVMSVAALERQLSASVDGEVQVHEYFTSLCDSIAASMIRNTAQISLAVDGGDGMVAGRVSVSLGLIVTELVINALKHAFPDGRNGKIDVSYSVHGPNWILGVRDDGVGMPSDPAQIHAGLGTSIVEALAKQLEAVVVVSSTHLGTKVTVEHTQIALVDDTNESLHVAAPAERSAAA